MGPAFNTATYSLLWAETLRIYRDMISTEDWLQKDVVTLKSVHAYTLRTAFLAISACGFGFKFKWDEPAEKEDGGMSVSEALRIWVNSVFVRVLIPSWVYRLPFKRYTLQRHCALISISRLSSLADCGISRLLIDRKSVV